MKIVSNGPRINGEAIKGIRAGVEKVYDNHAWTWAEFQSALDAYALAAFNEGYRQCEIDNDLLEANPLMWNSDVMEK